MKKTISFKYTILISLFIVLNTCSSQEPDIQVADILDNSDEGCDGQTYPPNNQSQYVLPFPVGKSYITGLTNCSSSFHAAGNPDQYAFDFNMPSGSPFVASRGGRVSEVVENRQSHGPSGLAGNYVVIDHGDNTFGVYLHSPDDGIYVALNDTVEQGQVLGITGSSGLAGYPHLHFIVVKNSSAWPYSGVAVSFRNASPPHIVLKGNTIYTALEDD
jgi:murein DD-endopeptidase MepM/ murein hydrolase activator NlpD